MHDARVVSYAAVFSVVTQRSSSWWRGMTWRRKLKDAQKQLAQTSLNQTGSLI